MLNGEEADLKEPLLEVADQNEIAGDMAYPDTASLTCAESQAPDSAGTRSENVITCLFSAPLVYQQKLQDDTTRLQAFPQPKYDMEKVRIFQCLKEASRDIELIFDNATGNRLIATISKGSSCLHYSGPGHKEFLPFENDAGGANWYPVTKLKELIHRENSIPFRCVFVAASFSERAGETIASAGVPHVVCCQQDSELKEAGVLAFTRQFYLSIAVGNTVKDAFDQACKAVLTTPNIRDPEEEMRKYVLLPRDENHDVPIFKARPVKEWPRSLSEEARRNSRTEKRGQIVRGLGLEAKNLLQEGASPTPPQFFLGREVEMYQVLNMILTKRLVSVVGDTGIGRSSLVCALCHYINERRNILITQIEKIHFVKVKQWRAKNRFVALLKQLVKRLSDEGRIDPVSDENVVESMIDAICKGLKTCNALIVFDHIELLEETDDRNEFLMLLQELMRETNVRILLTNRQPLGIPSLGEQHFFLGALKFESTVRLFTHLCPYIHTPADRRQFLERLVTSKEEGELLPVDDIPKRTNYLFDILGRGIPSRIENAAFCIHKDELQRLKDGSFHDDFNYQLLTEII